MKNCLFYSGAVNTGLTHNYVNCMLLVTGPGGHACHLPNRCSAVPRSPMCPRLLYHSWHPTKSNKKMHQCNKRFCSFNMQRWKWQNLGRTWQKNRASSPNIWIIFQTRRETTACLNLPRTLIVVLKLMNWWRLSRLSNLHVRCELTNCCTDKLNPRRLAIKCHEFATGYPRLSRANF